MNDEVKIIIPSLPRSDVVNIVCPPYLSHRSTVSVPKFVIIGISIIIHEKNNICFENLFNIWGLTFWIKIINPKPINNQNSCFERKKVSDLLNL